MALAEALHQLVWPGHTRGVGAHDQQQRRAVRSAEILGPDHVAVTELHSMLHGPRMAAAPVADATDIPPGSPGRCKRPEDRRVGKEVASTVSSWRSTKP